MTNKKMLKHLKNSRLIWKERNSISGERFKIHRIEKIYWPQTYKFKKAQEIKVHYSIMNSNKISSGPIALEYWDSMFEMAFDVEEVK